jgi:hypothetical protein
MRLSTSLTTTEEALRAAARLLDHPDCCAVDLRSEATS